MVRRTELDSSINRVRASVADSDESTLDEFERTMRKIWIAMHDKTPRRAVAAVRFWFEAQEVDASIPLIDLGIDLKSVAYLESAGITTSSDLCAMTRDQVTAIGNISRSRLEEIEVALECNGLRLRRGKRS